MAIVGRFGGDQFADFDEIVTVVPQAWQRTLEVVERRGVGMSDADRIALPARQLLESGEFAFECSRLCVGVQKYVTLQRRHSVLVRDTSATLLAVV